MHNVNASVNANLLRSTVVATQGIRKTTLRSITISQILIAISILATPVALGGVHNSVAAIVAAVGLLGLFFEQVRRKRNSQTPEIVVSIPTLGLALFALVCLLQVLPVPGWLQQLLNPVGYAAYIDSWQLAMPGQEVSTRWRSLSLEPQKTAASGLRWLALVFFSVTVANIGFSRGVWRKLLWTVMASGAVVWGIGLAQEALGTNLFLGFYKAEIPVLSLSTFVNKNHAAVFFGLVSLAAFAFVMQEYRDRVAQTIGAAAIGILSLVLMAMHQSDGTELAYGLGLLIIGAGLSLRMGAAQAARRRLAEVARTQWTALLTSLASAMVLFAWMMGSEWFAEKFEESDFGRWLDDKGRGRWYMLRAAVSGARDYWRFGSGSGSLELTLPSYVDWGVLRSGMTATIENEPVEWLMTMGVLVTLVGGGLLLSGLWFGRRGLSGYEKGARYIAAFGMSLYMLIVAMFHFPFYVLGLVLPFVVMVEYASAPRKISSKTGQLRSASAGHIYLPYRAGWWLIGVGAVVGVTLFVSCYFTYDFDKSTAFQEGEAPVVENVERWVRTLPTDSELFARLSIYEREQGNFERSAELADRSYVLLPNSRHLLFRARAHARVKSENSDKNTIKDRPETIALYQELFRKDRFADVTQPWIDRFMIHDVRTAKARAEVLSEAPPVTWIYAADKILASKGQMAAVDFSIELIERFPESVEAHLAMIRIYEKSKLPGLAELWARVLVSKNLLGLPDESPPGYQELIGLLVAQNNREEAWKLLQGAAEMNVLDGALLGHVLALRPKEPGDASAEQVRLIEHAHRKYCASPIADARLRTCWDGESWLHDLRGHEEEAQIVYRRIMAKWNEPVPLAEFLARHGKCQQLAGLLREITTGTYTSARRYRAAVEKLSRSCSR